ncbi:MAG TPA: FKBP-type peptidyl-prolyl cis-trans isomerase [Chitinophagales bacterium]|nr:FKBP-type peptidyl-prolyl cis-trans isomerase [Chitinophagales bacterium]
MKNSRIITKLLGAALIVAFTTLSISCKNDHSKPVTVKLSNDMDSISYALGGLAAKQHKGNGLDSLINLDLFFAGVQNEYLDKFDMKDEDIQNLFAEYEKKEVQKMIQKNIEKGASMDERTFLDENAKKPNIKTTATGLQYEIIKEGDGPQPNENSTVNVHYVGTHIDGTTFDSSVDRGEPVEFGLNQVIPGWTEGIQLMKVGSKFKFYIPSNLAYGEQGEPRGGIEPNETLIFEVDLLGFN